MLVNKSKTNLETLDYFTYIKGMFSSGQSNISENVEEIVSEEILNKFLNAQEHASNDT